MKNKLSYPIHYIVRNLTGMLLLLLSLSLLMTHAQATNHPIHANQTHIGHRINANTDVVTVTPNNPIAEFHLKANPSTGYQWAYRPWICSIRRLSYAANHLST